MRKSFSVLAAATLSLTACAQPGSNLAANVYRADQVNQVQEAKTVRIVAVLPAKVEVDNTENQRTAQLVGGLLGAGAGLALGGGFGHQHLGAFALGGTAGAATGVAAGSLVASRVLVDGVSLTYEDNGRILNSAQVGRICEFKQGLTIVVATAPGVTRLQANNECPRPA